MGEIDIMAHELLRDADEFSSLFNMAFFGGRTVVVPELLEEVNSVVSLSDSTGKRDGFGEGKAGGKGTVSIRDLVRRLQIKRDGGTAYVLLGVENQASIDYGMAVRLLNYDARFFMLQLNDAKRKSEASGDSRPFTSKFGPRDRLMPVVNLVVYYGDKPWNAATELSELFCDLTKEIEDGITPFLPSWRIKVVSPQSSDAELDMLGLGLRAVLYYARHAHDLAGMRKMLMERPDLRTPPPLAARLISSLMNIELILEEQKEIIDMWTVLEQAKAEGKAEGRAEGRAEGKAEGRAEGRAEGKAEGRAEERTEIIVNMYRNGMKISEISRVTSIPRARVRRMVTTKNT